MTLKDLFFTPQINPLVSFSAIHPDWNAIINDRKKFSVNRQLLYERLKAQNSDNLSKSVEINLNFLKKNNCFTITTGHQLCFGTGPLYVIYKTLSVIELCKRLNTIYPEYHFVPIFWLASEDHDFMEINHFYTDYQNLWNYKGTFQGAVGRHIIQNAPIFKFWVTEPYQKNVSWKNAFQKLLCTIFSEEGLIFIDGDDPYLKSSFSPFFLKEIIEKTTCSNVNQTNKILKNLNIKIQWNCSEINLFYLTDTKREKIHFHENSYFIGNQKVELNWLLEEVKNFPEKFSPNAGFRPLYQEFLLPNLAYIGGWSEIRYWLQLKSNFEAFRVFFPLLIPRFSHTIFSDKIIEKMKPLNLPNEFLLKPLKEIQREIAQRYYNFDDLKNHFYSIYKEINELQNSLQPYSETLVYFLETQKSYFSKIYLQLEKKIIKIIQNNNPSLFFEIYRLKDEVQPEGFIQERTLNISAFVKQIDELQNFMKELKHSIQPWVNTYVQNQMKVYN